MLKSLAILSVCASSALGFVAPGSKETARQSTSAGVVSLSGVSRSTSQLEAHKLVLIRHGESEWNDLNIFTGWADAALNEKGLREAAQGGQLLKDAGFTFDLCYTSVLKRAIKTLWIVLEEMDLMYLPIKNDWRLNERHYGGLQGLNKQETVDKHGKDQVLVWRRSYDIPPPACDESSEYYPGNDPRYANVDKEDLPFTESLKITGERFMPLWENEIAPKILAGEKILIAAHGNTLRALVKHLDNISEEEICGLNIPTGVPLVYELDDDLNVIPNENGIGSLQGMYLGNQEDIRARIEGVANQTK
mmetsp:Transcript_12031/g.28237  ORF Transcript_12031/g.28237 Transcript_12031/m.28237 type:complete len:305 (+) Transcript_12031:74-988(+)